MITDSARTEKRLEEAIDGFWSTNTLREPEHLKTFMLDMLERAVISGEERNILLTTENLLELGMKIGSLIRGARVYGWSAKSFARMVLEAMTPLGLTIPEDMPRTN